MKSAHHLLKFAHSPTWALVDRVGGLGGKKSQGTIAPIIDQLLTSAGVVARQFVFVKFMDGQKLDAGNPQLF